VRAAFGRDHSFVEGAPDACGYGRPRRLRLSLGGPAQPGAHAGERLVVPPGVRLAIRGTMVLPTSNDPIFFSIMRISTASGENGRRHTLSPKSRSFALESFGLKDEDSEAELEERLIIELEHFLLELGNDFAFIARQKHLRGGTEWFASICFSFIDDSKRSSL
jgi:hypothetical protein